MRKGDMDARRGNGVTTPLINECIKVCIGYMCVHYPKNAAEGRKETKLN